MTTRWLTEEEQRVWRLYLTACQSVFGGIEAQLLRDSGLPHGYYEILVHLSESEAKGRQDVQAAMKLLHPGMLLETPAFGTRVPGDAQVEETLRGSF